MTVQTQTFLAFVRRHFMPFSFLSARHDLSLYVFLNAGQESFGRFESGNVVGGDFDRGVLRNIAARLLGAGLDDEAAKASQINILPGNHVVLNDIHERFHGGQYDRFFQTRLSGDFGYYFCFCHFIV